MKQFIYLFFYSFTISIGYAQPNFTSSDMPNIGDYDTLMILQYHPITNNLDSETGNGYTWNFSSLPFNVQNLIDVDSFRTKQHFVSATYPNATIEEFKTGITGVTVNLYSYSNDTLIIHRLGSPSINYALGPIASIAFPILFNKSSVINAKIFTGSSFSVLVGERKTTTLYDGFGTLIMPNGKSHNNVFRIKQIERDTNYVTNAVTISTNYIWYKQGGQAPLLRLAYTGALNLYFVFGSKSNGSTSGINETNNISVTNIYPNPSNGQFYFSIDDLMFHKNCKVEVCNVLGQTIYHSAIISSIFDIDLSSHPRGVYFLKLYSDQTIFTKYLILQ